MDPEPVAEQQTAIPQLTTPEASEFHALLALMRERGVEAGIVNGITAGLAGATQCNIPLTLRGVSRGVTLITAHTQDDSELNWAGLAAGGTTLVVYMGVANIGQIAVGLMTEGLPASTPVMAISKATSADERRMVSSLSKIAQDAREAALKPPTLFIIGKVVTLYDVQGLPLANEAAEVAAHG